MAELLKQLDMEVRGREVLSAALRRVRGLKIIENQWVGRETGQPSDPGFDFRQKIETADGRAWWLCAAMKATGHPRQVRSAVWGLKRLVGRADLGPPVYPLVIAPFLSADSIAICEDEEVGYLDLSGNCHLEFGGVYVHVEGKPNRFKERRGIKTVFSPKASRVLRILLQGPLREHLVQTLAHEAGVSLGLVSKVRTHLLNDEFAAVGPEGIRITKPQALLQDWIYEDDLSSRTECREYSLLEQDHESIARNLHELLSPGRHAFTQWTAAHLRKPHVPPQVTSVYVEEFPGESQLKGGLKARLVERGGRLRLFRPKDDGVFLGGREILGLPVVSDVQMYLDLLDAEDELRASDAARELRELADFSGGWE